MHTCMYLAIVMRHTELIAERIVFGRSSTLISHFYNQYNVLPVTGFIRHTMCQSHCVPDEARDGRSIALIEEVTYWCA